MARFLQAAFLLLALLVNPVSAQFTGFIDILLAILAPLLAPFFKTAIASTCDTAQSLFQIEGAVDCDCGGDFSSQGLEVDIACKSERKSISSLPDHQPGPACSTL